MEQDINLFWWEIYKNKFIHRCNFTRYYFFWVSTDAILAFCRMTVMIMYRSKNGNWVTLSLEEWELKFTFSWKNCKGLCTKLYPSSPFSWIMLRWETCAANSWSDGSDLPVLEQERVSSMWMQLAYIIFKKNKTDDSVVLFSYFFFHFYSPDAWTREVRWHRYPAIPLL